jgi:hypothetical protein
MMAEREESDGSFFVAGMWSEIGEGRCDNGIRRIAPRQ